MRNAHRVGVIVTVLLVVSIAAARCFAQPGTGHPRLMLRAQDLDRLRSWAVPGNPIYQNGLSVVATRLREDMDAGRVPNQDAGGPTGESYPTEMYAEFFAFMSLISPDQAVRDDYARRSRSLLMYVMERAVQGAAEGQPFRHPDFATNDRSRWQGEAFALTVDWIYPYLSASDKATIRSVFIRWVNEILNEGYHHPEPVGVVNDPVLLSDRLQVRWAGNNYFTAGMRNIGLMSMALDPADDLEGRLRNSLRAATGAHLYIFDHLTRTDSKGGLLPEGFEYSPQTAGYVVQFILAMRTAGLDDPALWGPQVVLGNNPFWNDLIASYLHSLSPATMRHPDSGQIHQPAWYGDGQDYRLPDSFIGVFGPLGLYDYTSGNVARLQLIRWILTHMAPGGEAALISRARDDNRAFLAILHFLLFDPAVPVGADPRTSLPLDFFASGLGRILSRTSWNQDAAWFTYKLTWNQIDHQNADGNQFEFYRRGEWLTKERSGYDLDAGSSINHNTVALENDRPIHDEPGDYRRINWELGSQWIYVSGGDPRLQAYSLGPEFVYALGDSTALYNSDYEESNDIAHASRSIVWLKPDHIVVYDRAVSKTSGRFKRFWLNFPTRAAVSGNRATMTTPSGQKLFVSTLLPSAATITSEEAVVVAGDIANEEPMQFRVRVEAPGGPASTRFLHVLQGADAGGSQDSVSLLESNGGTPYTGALVKDSAVLFPVDLQTAFSQVNYSVPATASQITHLVTGLQPGGGYDVRTQTAGSQVSVTITAGTVHRADGGGVLSFKTSASGVSDPTIRFSIPDRGGLSLTSTGAQEAVAAGYARIQPDAGSTTPAGVAIFGFRQNGVLVTEAGVPASPLLRSGRIYAELGGAILTGVAIANSAEQDAVVDFFLTSADGTRLLTGTTIIPARGQIARFLNQSPFNVATPFSGSFTFSSSLPVSVIALRGLINERSEFLITTVPVVDLSQIVTNDPTLFPHFADGGGWTTEVVLVNPGDQVIRGTVQFLGQGSATGPAEPIEVTIDGQTGSSFSYTLPSGSARRFRTAGALSETRSGSVRITPQAGDRSPAGLGIFSFKNNGVSVSEAGVPALRAAGAFRIYSETSQSGDTLTGIAVANPSSNPVVVQFDLTTLSGSPTGLTGSMTIPGNGQIATFLNRIEGLEAIPFPFRGLLRVSTTSSSGVSVTGLRGRTNERGDFLITTTPPVDEGRLAVNSEMLFPHFVDGGGYTTQFILFSGAAGQSASGALRFFSQVGQQIYFVFR